MVIFKKNKKTSSGLTENIVESHLSNQKKVKKKKIGFGHKNKKRKKAPSKNIKQDTLKEPRVEKTENEQLKNAVKSTNDENIEHDIIDDLENDEELISEDLSNKGKKEEWSKSKRKTFIKKDMTGKPVFLEDTGEKVGTVFDSIYDGEENLVGYKIKDNRSDSILSFSLDQFGENKEGLIFVPSWYTKGIKTIEKLEFKDKISPELTWLLKDRTITEEELYNIFVKHDDIVANYIDEAVALRELISNRLKILQKERITLKDDLMDLTEKRLIKDIDRRKFSEIVMKHRTKVNVLDVNIKKCKDLMERLEKTSFGIISTTFVSKDGNKGNKTFKNRDFLADGSTQLMKGEENSYKIHQKNGQGLYTEVQEDYAEVGYPTENKTNYTFEDKYNNMKADYIDLQEEYNNLVEALENNLEDPYEDKYNNLKQTYKELQKEYNKLKSSKDKKPQNVAEEINSDMKKGYEQLQEEYNNLKEALENKLEDPYEDKYNNLKQNYDHLQEQYEELKLSVEKLLQK